jgi:WD40 repeat protein
MKKEFPISRPVDAGPSHDACATVKLQAAVTAVQFRPFVQHRQGVEGNSRVYLVAVGLDDGALQLWTVSLSADSVDASMTRGPNTNTAQGPNASTAQGANAAQTDWSKTAPSCVCTWQATQFEAHAGAVRKICWRRLSDPASWQLASCSDDHSIKLFDFTH